MKNKRPFEGIAKLIKRSRQGLRDPQLMYPEKVWGSMLLLMVLLFVSGVAWGVRTYQVYRDATNTESESAPTEVVVYREVLVEAALADFSDRAKVREQLLNERAGGPAVPPEDTRDQSPTEVTDTEASTSSIEMVADSPAVTPETETASTTEVLPSDG